MGVDQQDGFTDRDFISTEGYGTVREDRPSVLADLEHLAVVAQGLHERLDHVEKTLQPLLRPEGAQTGSDRATDPTAQRSDVAEKIETTRCDLERLGLRMLALLQRLEI